MNKAFQDFNWENFPSLNTPINATNLNKLNDAIDTIDDRVIAMDSGKASNDAISDEVETLDSEALYAHDADSFFLASNGKIYKATSSIAVGDIITVGTNCSLDNIVDNLGGGSQPQPVSSGHTIVDSNGTEYAQRAKLKFENATVTDDSTNDTTVVTPQGGGSEPTRTVQTLTAGSTSITFHNIPTTGSYIVDFYTNTGVYPYAQDISTPGQITLSFDAQLTDVVIVCEVKEMPQSILSQTLTAGSTSVTFTIPSSGNYFIDFYNSAGIPIKSLDTSTAGQVTVEFDAQSSDTTVFCNVEEVNIS